MVRLSSSHLAVCLALALSFSLSAQAATRRFAIIVGNNAGSGARPALRYSESDAGKMARVLAELGDVRPEDLLLLQGRNSDAVAQAFSLLKEKARRAKTNPDTRVLIVFYYSGHSDGESLELGSDRLQYSRLKSMLGAAGADLRVVIIDACKSGAAIAQKGGKPAPAFTIQLSDALTASGEVFITSSAADEAALESSELMGSFFTHNLVSGLRGAADVSGDRQVTLGEAYRYAHDRTLAATALLGTGQHALYDYRMSGQGELVLASLTYSSSTLELPSGADRALVTDTTRDQVVAEVPVGGAREIALPAGKYGVRLMRGGDAFGGRYTLVAGTRQLVRWEDLSPLRPLSDAVAMKGGDAEVTQSVSSTQRPADANAFWVNASVGAGKAILDDVGMLVQSRLALEPGLGGGVSFALTGGTGTSVRRGAGDVEQRLSENAVALRVGYRFLWNIGPLALLAGAEAGPTYLWTTQTNAGTSQALAMSVAARAGARLQLYGPLWLTLEAELPVTLLKLDEQLQARLVPAGTAGLALGF